MSRSRARCLLVALAVASCGPAPDPRVQAVLAAYAPDISLGSGVSAAARARYRLAVAPYLGYRDSSYVARDGLRDLGLRVDEYVDDGYSQVSRWARVESVQLWAPDAAAHAASEARLRAALGPPEVTCRRGTPRWRELRWQGSRGRGVRLVAFREPVPAPPGATWSGAGTAGLVEFGVEDDPEFAPPAEPCDPVRPPG